MLSSYGYRLSKPIENESEIKATLSVKPYIPSVFVNPRYVSSFKVYRECSNFLYVPKHFGSERFGPITSYIKPITQTDATFWEFTGKLREVQQPVVNSFLLPEPHDGIISLQTGGGKTICALYIASVLKLPTLVLVHAGFLKEQWIERIRAFLPHVRIGTIQGDTFDVENKDIVVGMLQTIALKDGLFRAHFGFVIVDECHHIGSEGFVKSMFKVSSKYMLGLSATPERQDRLMYVIHWCLGPLLYQSSNADKVDTKVNVEIYEFESNDPAYDEIIYNHAGVMFTSLMINKVVANTERNKFIVRILEDILDDNRQILVLSDRVDHCSVLYTLLPPDLQNTAGILARGMKSDKRTALCTTKKILFSTYQLVKEFFDVPTLNTLVMATSRPDIEQIVGRILRVEKHLRDVDPLIVNISDMAFRRQLQANINLYRKRGYQIQKMRLE